MTYAEFAELLKMKPAEPTFDLAGLLSSFQHQPQQQTAPGDFAGDFADWAAQQRRNAMAAAKEGMTPHPFTGQVQQFKPADWTNLLPQPGQYVVKTVTDPSRFCGGRPGAVHVQRSGDAVRPPDGSDYRPADGAALISRELVA